MVGLPDVDSLFSVTWELKPLSAMEMVVSWQGSRIGEGEYGTFVE